MYDGILDLNGSWPRPPSGRNAMLFYLGKIFIQLASPLGLCLFSLPIGFALFKWNRKRLGASIAVFGLAWLFLWSLPVASFWLRSTLERQTPQRNAADFPRVSAIVVLGGGMEGPRPGWSELPHLTDASDRIWFASRLYRAGRAPIVILSGGDIDGLSQPGNSEAQAMATFIEDLGVPASALMLEARSLNTWENARYTRQLMDEHQIGQILLVTSALHMPRALAAFRKAGIVAISAPADFEAVPPRDVLLSWLPDTTALDGSSRALKEYWGLFVYRLRGMA